MEVVDSNLPFRTERVVTEARSMIALGVLVAIASQSEAAIQRRWD